MRDRVAECAGSYVKIPAEGMMTLEMTFDSVVFCASVVSAAAGAQGENSQIFLVSN